MKYINFEIGSEIYVFPIFDEGNRAFYESPKCREYGRLRWQGYLW